MGKKAVETGIPRHARPFEWAIVADGIFYAAAAPIKADGTAETGDIRKQTRLTLDNLSKSLKAAGGSMADVTQVMLYVTKRGFIDPITEIWADAFPKPYPNRATVIVKEIGVKNVGLVVMATAHVGASRTRRRSARPARRARRAR